MSSTSNEAKVQAIAWKLRSGKPDKRTAEKALNQIVALDVVFDADSLTVALQEFADVQRVDFVNDEDYREARESAWDALVNSIETCLVAEDEEEEYTGPAPKIKEQNGVYDPMAGVGDIVDVETGESIDTPDNLVDAAIEAAQEAQEAQAPKERRSGGSRGVAWIIAIETHGETTMELGRYTNGKPACQAIKARAESLRAQGIDVKGSAIAGYTLPDGVLETRDASTGIKVEFDTYYFPFNPVVQGEAARNAHKRNGVPSSSPIAASTPASSPSSTTTPSTRRVTSAQKEMFGQIEECKASILKAVTAFFEGDVSSASLASQLAAYGRIEQAVAHFFGSRPTNEKWEVPSLAHLKFRLVNDLRFFLDCPFEDSGNEIACALAKYSVEHEQEEIRKEARRVQEEARALKAKVAADRAAAKEEMIALRARLLALEAAIEEDEGSESASS